MDRLTFAGKGRAGGPDLRRRIQEAAAAHNYRPNRVVQGVVGGRIAQIALIVGDLSLNGLSHHISALADAFVEHGYGTLLYNSHNDPKKEAAHIHHAISYRVSGLMVWPADPAATEAQFAELAEHGIPFIVHSEHAPTVAVPHIRGDDAPAAAALAEHLVVLGHRRIGILAAEFEHEDLVKRPNRLHGFCDKLEQLGVPLEADMWVKSGWSAEHAEAAGGQLLDRPQRPTAVFAMNDTLAAGVYKAARQRGLAIPRDLSIVGFGNAPFAKLLDPPLTTADHGPLRHAEAAVRVLERLMQLSPPHETPADLRDVKVDCQPRLRGSTAAAPPLEKGQGPGGRRRHATSAQQQIETPQSNGTPSPTVDRANS